MKNKKDYREKEMLNAFLSQSKNIIEKEEDFRKNKNNLLIGVESEVAIYKKDLAICDIEKTRDAIVEDVSDVADVEVGAAHIELRTLPIDISALSGFKRFKESYSKNFQKTLAAAKKQNCSLLRIGTNPFLPIKNTPRTKRPKYSLVPDYYNKNRPKEKNTKIGFGKNKVDVGDASIVALLQSFQVNIEAKSFNDAVDKMNRSLFINPYILGLSANARFLEFIDTKIQDVRMVAWEKSHDTKVSDLRMISWEKSFDLRTSKELANGHALRVGLPEKYFKTIDDYFKRMEQFPFILYGPDIALQIAIGMTWLDARIKFIGQSAVVELRPLSTQPTVEEEILITLLYLGRLIYSQIKNEPLLPMKYLKENRLSAMLYGPNKKMWFFLKDGTVKKIPYKIGMKIEIERAKQGLKHFGLEELLDLDLLELKLCKGSPSDLLAKEIYSNGYESPVEKMIQCLQKTKMLV